MCMFACLMCLYICVCTHACASFAWNISRIHTNKTTWKEEKLLYSSCQYNICEKQKQKETDPAAPMSFLCQRWTRQNFLVSRGSGTQQGLLGWGVISRWHMWSPPHVVRTEPLCQDGRLPCDLPVVSHGSPLPSLRVHVSPYWITALLTSGAPVASHYSSQLKTPS